MIMNVFETMYICVSDVINKSTSVKPDSLAFQIHTTSVYHHLAAEIELIINWPFYFKN